MRGPAIALAMLATTSAALAQQKPDPALEAMLNGMMQNTIKLNGTCKLLLTPDGDQTAKCDPELINMAFPSGNSSFIVTIKDKGGVSFRGMDSEAIGDTARLDVSMVILTSSDFAPPIQLKAKGQCTYTNPHAGPVRVDCTAKTDRGVYQLSYVSDGSYPAQ